MSKQVAAIVAIALSACSGEAVDPEIQRHRQISEEVRGLVPSCAESNGDLRMEMNPDYSAGSQLVLRINSERFCVAIGPAPISVATTKLIKAGESNPVAIVESLDLKEYEGPTAECQNLESARRNLWEHLVFLLDQVNPEKLAPEAKELWGPGMVPKTLIQDLTFVTFNFENDSGGQFGNMHFRGRTDEETRTWDLSENVLVAARACVES